MAGRRRRLRQRPDRRIARDAVCCLAGAAVMGAIAARAPTQAGVPAAATAPSSAVPAARSAAVPRGVAHPSHLDTAYVAPPAPARSALGRLRIARLGIDAPVVRVGWDGDTMAVPNDVRTIGWFTPSAHLDDLAGASLIAGHVADGSGRPGALSSLSRARAGDVVEWSDAAGRVSRFRVVTIERYPRATGLPASLLRVDGPHVLRLVTCTHRVQTASGYHYADNLLVTAVQL